MDDSTKRRAAVLLHPRLRQASSDDATSACELVRRAIRLGCHADHGGRPVLIEHWLRHKTPEKLAQLLDCPDTLTLVAEDRHRLLGCASLRDCGQLVLCYVEPTTQMRGVGRAMLAELERQAVQRGLDRIYLNSTRSALGFYVRLGFVQGSCDDGVVHLRGDLLHKPLRPAEPVQRATP